MLKMPKKAKYVRFENYERKTKSQFMINADYRDLF